MRLERTISAESLLLSTCVNRSWSLYNCCSIESVRFFSETSKITPEVVASLDISKHPKNEKSRHLTIYLIDYSVIKRKWNTWSLTLRGIDEDKNESKLTKIDVRRDLVSGTWRYTYAISSIAWATLKQGHQVPWVLGRPYRGAVPPPEIPSKKSSTPMADSGTNDTANHRAELHRSPVSTRRPSNSKRVSGVIRYKIVVNIFHYIVWYKGESKGAGRGRGRL